MAKLLIVGTGPLFEDDVSYLGAHSLRTWYFVEPLLEQGHSIRLVTLPLFDPGKPEMHHAALTRRSIDGFEYQAFSNCDAEFAIRTLTRLARSFRPDGIVAINNFPSWIVAQLPLRAPMWADMNGYGMAEAQGQAAREGSDEGLENAWRVETLIARRADKFSVVSRAQLHALLGEMAALGRLNHLTFHYRFVHHVPNAWHPRFGADVSAPAVAQPILRGPVAPEDALIVLWTGGYNYWTDPDRLADFLEMCMQAEPRLHYVSTGGAIEGYNSSTYERFQARVEQSAHRERFHLLGWVPGADVPRIYAEVDVGLNFDEPNYETLFGARNRLTNLMAAGVPILSTHGTEISREIDETRCGLVRPAGDLDALRRALMEMLRSPQVRRYMSDAGRTTARERFAPARLAEAVCAWAESPRFSPDNYEKLSRFPEAINFPSTALNSLQEVAAVMHDCDLDVLIAAQEELQALRAHPLYSALRGARNTIMAPVDWVRTIFAAGDAGAGNEE